MNSNQTIYEEEIEVLKNVLQCLPDNYELLFKIGELYFLLCKYNEALSYLSQCVYNNPQHAHAFHLLGRTYTNLGKLDNATECYKKAAEIDYRYSIDFGALQEKGFIWGFL